MFGGIFDSSPTSLGIVVGNVVGSALRDLFVWNALGCKISKNAKLCKVEFTILLAFDSVWRYLMYRDACGAGSLIQSRDPQATQKSGPGSKCLGGNVEYMVWVNCPKGVLSELSRDPGFGLCF